MVLLFFVDKCHICSHFSHVNEHQSSLDHLYLEFSSNLNHGQTKTAGQQLNHFVQQDKRGAARDKTGTATDKTGTTCDKTGKIREKTRTARDKTGTEA